MLTVRELIAKLKNFPPDSYVGYQTHDNTSDEITGIIDFVDEFNPEESFDPNYCKNVFVVVQG